MWRTTSTAQSCWLRPPCETSSAPSPWERSCQTVSTSVTAFSQFWTKLPTRGVSRWNVLKCKDLSSNVFLWLKGGTNSVSDELSVKLVNDFVCQFPWSVCRQTNNLFSVQNLPGILCIPSCVHKILKGLLAVGPNCCISCPWWSQLSSLVSHNKIVK